MDFTVPPKAEVFHRGVWYQAGQEIKGASPSDVSKWKELFGLKKPEPKPSKKDGE